MKPRIIFLIPIIVFFASCHTREVAYISDAERNNAETIIAMLPSTIMPGDQIYIHVASQTTESVIPFNQETNTLLQQNKTQSVEQMTGNNTVGNVPGYIVGRDGTIQFPLIGKISVVGITHDSLRTMIEQQLRDLNYVSDPQVTTRLMNFRVTVVGEVRNPKQIHFDGTRLTIFEALALCGDITPYGRRDNILVMRTANGSQEIGEINVTKKEMFDSPYYYLRSNDIVYIEPSKKRKRIATRNSNIPSYISLSVSVMSIIHQSINTARILQTNQ